MTALREAPVHPDGFRHLRELAAYWNGTWRYRPAGADLEAALQQAGAEVEAALQQAKDAVAAALGQVEAARRGSPDVLIAHVYGDSIPEIRGAALIEGAALWGEKADLAVEGIDTVRTSAAGNPRGRFRTAVSVRCLNYAEIEQQVSEVTR